MTPADLGLDFTTPEQISEKERRSVPFSDITLVASVPITSKKLVSVKNQIKGIDEDSEEYFKINISKSVVAPCKTD